jgi:hypothetical protein
MNAGESFRLNAVVTAAIGRLAEQGELFRLFGMYTGVQQRVYDNFATQAEDLSGQIMLAMQRGDREIAKDYEKQLIALPRYVVDEDVALNLVTDVGGRLVLDTILAGSAFTAATYMGLKGSGSAAVGDTQASHAGWLEVGAANAPAYTAPRKTVTWSAASGSGAGSRTKASSGTYTYTFTSGGTVDGAFLNINGATTIDNTTGTLLSAGTFTGGAKTVANTDTLTVTYALNC